MFVIIGAGYVCSKLKVISAKTSEGISGILTNITFPALIVASMHQDYSTELLSNSLAIIVISLAVHLLCVLVAFLWTKWFKLPHAQMAILRFIIIIGSNTFMGFPIIAAVYGQLGIFYAASFNMVSIFFLFTYCIWLLSQKSSTSLKTLLNPGFVAVVIGYIIFLTPLELPYVLLRPLQWVGDITIPLALLVVGNSLASVPLRELFNDKQAWYVSWERLLILPLLIFVFLKVLDLNPFLIGVPVILTATPGPLLAGAFARTYGCDGLLGDKTTVLSHLLSVFTLPLIVLLVTM